MPSLTRRELGITQSLEYNIVSVKDCLKMMCETSFMNNGKFCVSIGPTSKVTRVE